MRALGILGILLFAIGAAALGMRQTAAAPQRPGDAAAGGRLYAASCASCHGAEGGGGELGPSLQGVGAAALDFQLRTGRMPYAQGPGQQALRKPPAFDPQQIADLVAYLAGGVAAGGPEIPAVDVKDDLLSRGQKLFVANCAPCHGATGSGGAVGGGALAPSLDRSQPVVVAEAMVIGPGQMPVFRLADEDRNAVVTYVDYLRTAATPGGFSIGSIGPVPEGLVGWLVGMGLMTLIAFLIGRDWGTGE